jgi:hypothetical protein
MTTKRALKRNQATAISKGTASKATSGLSERHLDLVRRACAVIDARDGQGVTLT